MKYPFLFWSVLIFAVLFACQDPVDLRPEDKNAYLQIRLTDAPGDIDAVFIDLLQVQIKTQQTNGFLDLNTIAGVYDLLQYQAGDDTLIVNDSLPAGQIQQIRLILGPQNRVMVDSVLYDLKVPSGMESGIKINFSSIAVQDSLTQILLDFDAEKSIVKQGNGRYSLKPVIKATTL